jgi:hypothetical protein
VIAHIPNFVIAATLHRMLAAEDFVNRDPQGFGTIANSRFALRIHAALHYVLH